MPRLSFLLVEAGGPLDEQTDAIIRKAYPSSTVLIAASEEAACELCRERAFDCVFIDQTVPDFDALLLARALLDRVPHFPIVLLTSSAGENIDLDALEMGVAGHIPKYRLSAGSLRRIVERAVCLSEQRKLIDSQRADMENFAHSLAHDFKQPLRQISTFVQMISDELAGELSPSVRRQLKYLRQSSKRLNRLVDVMADYTLLHKPIRCEPLAFSTLFREAVETLDEYIAERGGTIHLSGDARVLVQPVLMISVLRNLFVNGLKYNDSDAPRIDVVVREVGVDCEVRVIDNGIGIEEEYQEAIFSPLVRLHTQEQHTGTGLGLAVVRKSLMQQGGRIACRSGERGGTEMVLAIKSAAAVPQLDGEVPPKWQRTAEAQRIMAAIGFAL